MNWLRLALHSHLRPHWLREATELQYLNGVNLNIAIANEQVHTDLMKKHVDNARTFAVFTGGGFNTKFRVTNNLSLSVERFAHLANYHG